MTTPKTPVRLHIASRVRRKQLGLRQADIAESMHVTSVSIGQWEAGTRRIRLEKMPLLAELLGFEPQNFCRTALFEAAPRFYRSVFGSQEPQPLQTMQN